MNVFFFIVISLMSKVNLFVVDYFRLLFILINNNQNTRKTNKNSIRMRITIFDQGRFSDQKYLDY